MCDIIYIKINKYYVHIRRILITASQNCVFFILQLHSVSYSVSSHFRKLFSFLFVSHGNRRLSPLVINDILYCALLNYDMSSIFTWGFAITSKLGSPSVAIPPSQENNKIIPTKNNIPITVITAYLLYKDPAVFRRTGALNINFHHLKNHSIADFRWYLFSSWSKEISLGSS